MRAENVTFLAGGLLALASVASPAPASGQESATDEAATDDAAGNAGTKSDSDTSAADDGSGKDTSDAEKSGGGASAHAEATISVDTGKAPFRRFWFGVAGALDLAVVGGVDDVCKLGALALPLASSNAYCTNPDGSDFPSRSTPAENDALIPGRSGTLDGGVKVGNVRVMFAADYAVTGSVLVGLRLGYVLNSYPGDAAISGRPAFLRNLHVEARGTYVFGRDALVEVGFAPMAFFGAGAATSDGHDDTSVSLAGVRGQTAKNAWQVGGPFFATLGGGARYAFSSRAAFTATWKTSLAFGSPGALFTTGPELGFQYGF
jgi:hypothetical protein